MLVSSMGLKIQKTKTHNVIISKTMIIQICQYLRNAIAYEPKMWHLKLTFHTDLKYYNQNSKWCPNKSKLITSLSQKEWNGNINVFYISGLKYYIENSKFCPNKPKLITSLSQKEWNGNINIFNISGVQ